MKFVPVETYQTFRVAVSNNDFARLMDALTPTHAIKTGDESFIVNVEGAIERAPVSTLMELCGEELVYTAIKDESAAFIEFEMSGK